MQKKTHFPALLVASFLLCLILPASAEACQVCMQVNGGGVECRSTSDDFGGCECRIRERGLVKLCMTIGSCTTGCGPGDITPVSVGDVPEIAVESTPYARIDLAPMRRSQTAKKLRGDVSLLFFQSLEMVYRADLKQFQLGRFNVMIQETPIRNGRKIYLTPRELDLEISALAEDHIQILMNFTDGFLSASGEIFAGGARGEIEIVTADGEWQNLSW